MESSLLNIFSISSQNSSGDFSLNDPKKSGFTPDCTGSVAFTAGITAMMDAIAAENVDTNKINTGNVSPSFCVYPSNIEKITADTPIMMFAF